MEPQLTSAPLQILLVEDEADIADPIAEVLAGEGHSVSVEYDGGRGLVQLQRSAYDLMISDVRLPQVDGLELFEWVREHTPATAVVLMSAYGSIPEAVSTLRKSAVHYLHKPFHVDELLRTVEQVAEQALMRGTLGKPRHREGPIQSAIIGRSPSMLALKNRLEAIADCDAPILIHGETGTGKEVVARAIHAASARCDRPFVPVNCGAFPETLIESELFGHERGAFTGASSRRDGRFVAADGGTLFLDEVTEMSPASQVKLLRVLQDGRVHALGSDQGVTVDARILSATNVDIRALLRTGRFREDLFYRLRVLDAHLPALRDRSEDLPLLVGHFLRQFGTEPVPQLSACAWALLRQYPFPGNVRELEHAVQHALVLSRGGPIDVQHLPDEIRGRSSASDSRRLSLSAAMSRFEHDFVLHTLEEARWNKTRAAQLLGISRKNLWEKIKRYDIKAPDKD